MQETQNEQLAEQTERKQRAGNIILHGIEEDYGTDENERKQIDEAYVHSLFDTVAKDISFKSITRLGKVDSENTKKRPIKVVMKSEEAKIVVMSNLRKLKGKEEFNGLSITEDYTTKERELIRQYTEKAKEANSNEPVDSKTKVRGNPKNGLVIKKFQKKLTI